MTMLLPSFNFIGENGIKEISFAYYHITKVKQNFFLTETGGGGFKKKINLIKYYILSFEI